MHQWLGVRPFSQAFRVRAWLLPSVLGSLLLSLPVHAAQLQFWRFDPNQNRLSFTTSGAVQPRVQLIPNPTRLVVDLPGTQLNRPTVKQTLAGTVRSVRVGQFDGQTARIVVELAPNYVVDPALVKVTPSSASNWSIDLPQPQLIGAASPSLQPPPSPRPITRPPSPPPTPAPTTPTPVSDEPFLSDISVTPDGLFLDTSKAPRKVSVKRRRRDTQVRVTLLGVRANPKLLERTFKPGYYGLRELSVRQRGKASSPDTEVLFTIDKNGPDWTATTSRFGGVVLIPQSRSLKPSRPSSTVSLLGGPSVTAAQPPSEATAATIQTVSLGGDRLLVSADQPIAFSTGWEGSSYRLTLQASRPAPGVQAPRVAVGSPLSRIQFRQDPAGFSILSTPARGVRIAGVQRLSDTQVLLLLRRSGQAPLPPIVNSGSNNNPAPSGPLPRVSGRRVVVIDPGHGGRDPGAIGINGLRETNVVLPISLDVSRILQRQGVTVYLTRTDEREIDLAPRVALAERVRANVFVSIHANAISLSRPDVNGLETYYAPGSSAGKRLAETIHNTVLGNVNIGSRGVRSARFFVIRRTSMPAALVETGFVTGAIDNPKLANPAFRRQMAEAIARGILEYLARN